MNKIVPLLNEARYQVANLARITRDIERIAFVIQQPENAQNDFPGVPMPEDLYEPRELSFFAAPTNKSEMDLVTALKDLNSRLSAVNALLNQSSYWLNNVFDDSVPVLDNYYVEPKSPTYEAKRNVR